MAKEDIDPNIAPMIAELVARRKSRNLVQIDIDRLTGWASGSCGKYEAGIRRPGMVAFAWWAEVLGCQWVLDTKGFPRPQWKSSATLLINMMENHDCRLKLKETAGQCEKRTEQAAKLADELEDMARQIRAA